MSGGFSLPHVRPLFLQSREQQYSHSRNSWHSSLEQTHAFKTILIVPRMFCAPHTGLDAASSSPESSTCFFMRSLFYALVLLALCPLPIFFIIHTPSYVLVSLQPPSQSLPTLLETAAEDAQVVAGNVATGTAAGLEAAAAALWGALAELGGSTVDQAVRQALLPIHSQHMSALRVSAAINAERAALLPPPPSQGRHIPVYSYGLYLSLERVVSRRSKKVHGLLRGERFWTARF